jgi:hypothetical protein
MTTDPNGMGALNGQDSVAGEVTPFQGWDLGGVDPVPGALPRALEFRPFRASRIDSESG